MWYFEIFLDSIEISKEPGAYLNDKSKTNVEFVKMLLKFYTDYTDVLEHIEKRDELPPDLAAVYIFVEHIFWPLAPKQEALSDDEIEKGRKFLKMAGHSAFM